MPLRPCAEQGCGRLFEPQPRVHRCPACQAAWASRDNARRNAKQWRQGRNAPRWQKLRKLALARDGCCQECGTTEDLTVHLAEELEGNHWAATVDDLTVYCRSCHGRRDAPRAARGRGV